MAIGAAHVYVRTEMLNVVEGFWCRCCALPSAARFRFILWIGPVMSLREVDRCRECGSDKVDPPES